LFSAIVKCSLFRVKESVSFVMFSAAVCKHYDCAFGYTSHAHTHTHTHTHTRTRTRTHLFLKLPHTLGDKLIARVITAICKTRSD
jgi:hypothetical protein